MNIGAILPEFLAVCNTEKALANAPRNDAKCKVRGTHNMGAHHHSSFCPPAHSAGTPWYPGVPRPSTAHFPCPAEPRCG